MTFAFFYSYSLRGSLSLFWECSTICAEFTLLYPLFLHTTIASNIPHPIARSPNILFYAIGMHAVVLAAKWLSPCARRHSGTLHHIEIELIVTILQVTLKVFSMLSSLS